MATTKKAAHKKVAPAKKTASKKTAPAKRIAPVKNTDTKTIQSNNNFAAINSSLIESKLNDIILTLKNKVEEKNHFASTGQMVFPTNSEKATVQESFKDNVHDIIVNHEVAIAKNKIENELQNCGDVYYVTQAEKDKMIKAIKQQQAEMALDFVLLFGLAFVLGRLIGSRIGFDQGYETGNHDGHQECLSAIKRDFNLTPKQR